MRVTLANGALTLSRSPHIPYVHPKMFEQYYPNSSVDYPPSPGFVITENVPLVAPHDWTGYLAFMGLCSSGTGEGSTYGDLKDLNIRVSFRYHDCLTDHTQGNVPRRTINGKVVESREFNWTTM